MWLRAVSSRGGRRLISRLGTLQHTIQSSQVAGAWGNLSDFAIAPAIPDLGACNLRREFPAAHFPLFHEDRADRKPKTKLDSEKPPGRPETKPSLTARSLPT